MSPLLKYVVLVSLSQDDNSAEEEHFQYIYKSV